jgi:hypothetical protein
LSICSFHPAGIVKQREEPHHLGVAAVRCGYPHAILQHTRPVHDPVIPVHGQRVAAQDLIQDQGMIMHRAHPT